MRLRFVLITLLIFSILIIPDCDKKNPTESDDPETVTDIDGNVYKTVKIGNQW